MQASRARRGKEDLGYSWRGRESPVAEAGAGAGAGKDLTGSLRIFSTKFGLFIQPAQTYILWSCIQESINKLNIRAKAMNSFLIDSRKDSIESTCFMPRDF